VTTASRPPALWWIRRDLRLADNQALAEALARGGPVVPVFVLDPDLLGSREHGAATRRRGFLFAGLRALDAALGARGARLVVRRGRPASVLRALVAEVGASGVMAEEDYSPYARRRDAAVAATVPLSLVGGVSVRHPRDVVKADGNPYSVYTPFARAWRALPLPDRRDLLAAPRELPPPPRVEGEALPAGEEPPAFPAGEAEAERRLARFACCRDAPVHCYGDDRDRPDRDGTSALSPYLRFGMVSPRRAVVAALEAGGGSGRQGSGADRWLAELVWREFYLAVLYHFPHVLAGAFNRELARVPWRRAPADLRAWQSGRTGYPIVDAGMRQLTETGWIHNRARMIVASFLAKDLLVDWRAGEAWFMRQLIDGDPAANNGGWQWVAGTGTDGAPYFRIFNPVLQAKKFDPEGAYVRRWVPELARAPASMVHEPWRRSPVPAAGRDGYPMPIVEHGLARARALAAYERARGGK